MQKKLTKHNIKRILHHIKNGNYRFLYEKIKNSSKQIPRHNNSQMAREGSCVTDYFNYIFHQNNNKKENIPFKKHMHSATDIKAIAFYLPQFHPIKENDEWWGKGFTEWTNVAKALPQFEGHYQPRLPGELGYYDLRLPEIQKRQVELAKNYGIFGFCFHYYWFNGRRVLEKPLNAYLENKNLDFPFCINWANENWTKRWDGQDQDILLQQKHSDEDDLEFIKEISKMFKDKRYIRVDGKPLLMIYRPSDFPDIKASSERWRRWCLNNGIGEIYLVLTHAFEHIDPKTIGFDAATEFAPNSFPLKIINESLNIYNDYYEGEIRSYSNAIKYSQSISRPKYKKFRSLCPGWDNEARKPGRGTTIHGATPDLYATWLRYLCKYTDEVFEGDERLIFINAWNEWGEGAYLEPDQKFGYGYLEKTHQILTSYKDTLNFNNLKEIKDFITLNTTAVIIHLYYPDVWEELKQYLSNIGNNFDLYINVNQNIDFDSLNNIRNEFPKAFIVCLENRGRDILPFLEIYRTIEDKDYKYICKLHSKKSFHRIDGDIWRDHLVQSLIGSKKRVQKAKKLLDENSNGIVVAKGNSLSYNDWIGSNEYNIKSFAKKANINIPKNFNFPAGSMFWFKPKALKLLTENLDQDAFAPEEGQVDGTMAHATERLFGLICKHNNFKIIEI